MWWILAWDTKMKPNLFGPYYSEMRAQQAADSKGLRDPEYYQLNTKDTGRATQMLKEKLTSKFGKEDGQWEKGMQKFRHPKSISMETV